MSRISHPLILRYYGMFAKKCFNLVNYGPPFPHTRKRFLD